MVLFIQTKVAWGSPNIDTAVFSPLALSTDDLPIEDRFEACRELFRLGVSRAELSSEDPQGFRATISLLPLPSFVVLHSRVTPCSLTRPPALLRDNDDSLVFGLCVSGSAEMRFEEDRVRLPGGSATLISNQRRGGFFSATGASCYSLRVEREMLRSFVPGFEKVLLAEWPAADSSLTILNAYLGALLAQRQALSLPLATLADGQIKELLAHILNPTSDLARSAPYGGVKAARLRAILDHVCVHIAEPELSAQSVGARLGLSARYVQQLVDGAGMSFSDYVRNLRLDRAKRILSDARYAHLRITDICAMTGFNSLSHFNRRFRARFGETPTKARRR